MNIGFFRVALTDIEHKILLARATFERATIMYSRILFRGSETEMRGRLPPVGTRLTGPAPDAQGRHSTVGTTAVVFLAGSDIFPAFEPGMDPIPLAVGIEEVIPESLYRPFFEVVPNDGRVLPLIRPRPTGEHVAVPSHQARPMEGGRFL